MGVKVWCVAPETRTWPVLGQVGGGGGAKYCRLGYSDTQRVFLGYTGGER